VSLILIFGRRNGTACRPAARSKSLSLAASTYPLWWPAVFQARAFTLAGRRTRSIISSHRLSSYPALLASSLVAAVLLAKRVRSKYDASGPRPLDSKYTEVTRIGGGSRTVSYRVACSFIVSGERYFGDGHDLPATDHPQRDRLLHGGSAARQRACEILGWCRRCCDRVRTECIFTATSPANPRTFMLTATTCRPSSG